MGLDLKERVFCQQTLYYKEVLVVISKPIMADLELRMKNHLKDILIIRVSLQT
jgi:hypothetical protein